MRALEAVRMALAFVLAFACLVQPAVAYAESSADESGDEAAQEAAKEAAEEAAALRLSESDKDLVKSDENAVDPQQQPDSSFIYDVSIADLAAADSYMDGRTVQVSGEAVGDIINAENDSKRCWVVIASTDGGQSGNVSVYMLRTAAEQIDTLGAYGKTGTVLQVQGTFNLVCKDHNGLSDVHADVVSVVEKGQEWEQSFNMEDMVRGIALIVVGVLMYGVYRFLRERQR